MKKKILILIIFLLSISFLTGCNNEDNDKGKIVFKEDKTGYKVTFDNLKEMNLTDKSVNTSGPAKTLTYTSKKHDIEITMNYKEHDTQTFDTTKKVRKSHKYFGEYKFGKYKAYSYGNNDNSLNVLILLDKKYKGNEILLNVSINRIDTDKSIIVKEVFDKEEVQNFFKTIKYRVEKTTVK